MGEWASLTFKCCTCLMVISINIVILIMGVMVNRGGSIYFGNLIKMETDDWNRSPIVSLVNPANNAQCPVDTDTITGTFSGTETRCNLIGGSYTIGACRRRQGLYTTAGLPPTTFDKFDG